MKKIVYLLAVIILGSTSAGAAGYQSGWKVYEKPQAGATKIGSNNILLLNY